MMKEKERTGPLWLYHGTTGISNDETIALDCDLPHPFALEQMVNKGEVTGIRAMSLMGWT